MNPTRDEVMAMDEDALGDAVMAVLCFSTVVTQSGIVFLSESAKNILVAYMLEAQLPEERRGEYGGYLTDIIERRTGGVCYAFDAIHATPADRCRAWLLTMKDGEK